jgi:uncharacterized protein YrrD
MMQRTSELIGKPIVSADRGERIGTVDDVLLDGERRRAIGLVVHGGVLAAERVLPYDQVQVLGRDAIIAASHAGIIDAESWRRRRLVTTRVSSLRSRRVITRSGRELGALRDVYLDQSGAIGAYDVERSGFAGLVHHRARLPLTEDVAIGDDAVIVSDDAADEFVPIPHRES